MRGTRKQTDREIYGLQVVTNITDGRLYKINCLHNRFRRLSGQPVDKRFLCGLRLQVV